MENIDEKSCGIVVFRETNGQREYLLLKYLGKHIDFVKGHVEEGEDEHETAFRELVEETAISDLQFIEGFREEIIYSYKRKGKPSTKKVVFFLGKTNATEVTLSPEHLDYYWLPYGESFNKVTFDNARDLLKKAENFLP